MTDTKTRRAAPQLETTNPWIVLAVLCSSIFMLLLDTTIVNNAQRKIQIGLEADLSQIQWILDSYILAYAVLLLSFGRMGDIFGRKKFFVVGTIIFTVASGLCGIAGPLGDVVGMSGADALIAARVLQGIGAAMMMPQSLSIISQVFPPEKRGSALGIWGAVVGLGAVTGPLLGGFIATNYPWEWVFLINLPIGVLGVFASVRFLPETLDPDASKRLDWGGVLLSGASIFMLVYALIEGNHLGWTSGAILGLIATSVATFLVFLWWELRHPRPMVRLELFRIRNFAIANAMFTILAFGMLGIFFPLTIFLQGGLGYSPFEAGLIGAPLSLSMMVAAPLAGRFTDRFGARRPIIAGMGAIVLGIMLLASQVATDTTWGDLVIPMIITGVGMGLTMSPMTAVAMQEVPRGIAGSASGIINTTRSVGQVLGIAVLGSVLQTRMSVETEDRLARVDLDAGLKDQLVTMAEGSQFQQIASSLSAVPDLIPVVMGLIGQAFVNAVRFTFFSSAAICVIGFVVALMLRDPQRAEATQPVANKEDSVAPRPATTAGE